MKRLIATAIFVLMAVSANAGDLQFNPKLMAGFGGTFDKAYYRETGNAGYHFSGGATLLSLDKSGNVGLLGLGTALNVNQGDYGQRDSYAKWVVTVIPVRVGPFAYQLSLARNNDLGGIHHGRLHLFTFDILGYLRLVNTF